MEKGAKFETKNRESALIPAGMGGAAALIFAAHAGKTDLVKLLLEWNCCWIKAPTSVE